MNVNKAREFFSAHYEGTLERGLKQSFETALAQDAQLQAEYRAFERTMKELDGLSAITIEPPEDLHERIAARLDRVAWEAKNAKPTGVRAWWRMAVVGATATAVIALAVFQSRSGSTAVVNTSGIVPNIPGVTSNDLEFSKVPDGVSLNVKANKGTIKFLNREGTELEQKNLESGPIDRKLLANSGDEANLVGIKLDTQDVRWLAIPGKGARSIVAGSGSLKDFGTAIAKGFGTPVVLDCKDAELQVSWDREQELMPLVNKAVAAHNLKVELRKANGGDILWIQQN
ncbi:MAG: hypothetical protein ABL949_05920 [Fimbriimonadaceae bacterium]